MNPSQKTPNNAHSLMQMREGEPAQAEVEELKGMVEYVEQVEAEVDKAHDPMLCTCMSESYYRNAEYMYTLTNFVTNIHVTFILFIHVCTEPTEFITAISNDPNSYKGSQLSPPPVDNQWYKGDDEEDANDDQLLNLKLIHTGTSRNSRHESKGSEAMEICSVEAGSKNDGNENEESDQ